MPVKPRGLASKGTLYQIRIEVREFGFAAKFEKPHGSGIGISRDNPHYYDTIGRWLCAELEAGCIMPDGTVELNP